MSQPLPSRQRKAWLPPSLSALRYPATPRPSRARITTIQSGPPRLDAAAGSVGFGRFSLAIRAPRAPHGAPPDYRTEVGRLPPVFERIYSTSPRRCLMTHANRREFLAGALGLVAGGLAAGIGS